jgi:hypothetical protein
MIIKFLSEAHSELIDAVAYYEGELSGLGQRLWSEVDEHIAWIAGKHEVPRLRSGGYRRVNLKVFPYLHFLYRSRSGDLDLSCRTRA